jgi:hypothetical protein
MADVPPLLVDGHNLLFRACFGTPAQIWSRDSRDKRDLTTEFMFFALLRNVIITPRTRFRLTAAIGKAMPPPVMRRRLTPSVPSSP